MEEQAKSKSNWMLVQFFARLFVFATILGVANSSVVRLLQVTLDYIWAWLDTAILVPYPKLLVLLPGIGGLLAGVLVYRIRPEASGEGVPLYIDTVHEREGKFVPFVGLYKFFAALFVMGFRGSGGFVGPVVAINAHVGAWIHKQLRRISGEFLGLSQRNFRRGAICGVAAALGALFKIPVAGGIFAVEILSPDKLYYTSMFPAVLASAAGAFCYMILYDPTPVFETVTNFEVTLAILPGIFLTAVFSGFVGLYFVRGFKKSSEFLKQLKLPVRFIPFIGGLLAGVVGLFLGRETLGTGQILIGDLINNQLLISAAVIFLVGRMLTTSFTIGSGGSAGFTFPSILMGFLSGHIVSVLVGPFSSGNHLALLITGMSGVLASVMNIPLAAIIMSIEIFGYQYAIPALAGSIIGFHIARSEIIYEYGSQSYDLD